MIGIDTYGDGRYMVSLGANAEGNQLDLKFLPSGNDDTSYNVSYESKASKHPDATGEGVLFPGLISYSMVCFSAELHSLELTTPSKVGSVFCANAKKENNKKRGLILMIGFFIYKTSSKIKCYTTFCSNLKEYVKVYG
tara:strand:- start:194 stop:607 length:414 start_codon:yes stop_codon:yes gene_type:complete